MAFAAVPRKAQAEEEMTRLMTQYGRQLKRMCFLYLRDDGLAEDAAQETFFKVYKSRDGFHHGCSEKTWIMRIAMNTCRDMLRTAWLRRVDTREKIDDSALPAPDAPGGDDTVMNEIMALPPKYKETILLYYYQGMNTSEVAQALKIPVDTVKSRLSRGRERLKAKLEGWYFDE